MQILLSKSGEVIEIEANNWFFYRTDGSCVTIYGNPNVDSLTGSGEWTDVTDEYPKTFRQEALIGDDWYVTFTRPNQKVRANNGSIDGMIEWTEELVARDQRQNEGSRFAWQECSDSGHSGSDDNEFDEIMDAYEEIEVASDMAGRMPEEPLADFVCSKLREIERLEAEITYLRDQLCNTEEIERMTELRGVREDIMESVDGMACDCRIAAKEARSASLACTEASVKVDDLDCSIRMSAVAYIVGTTIAGIVYASMMYQIFWSHE